MKRRIACLFLAVIYLMLVALPARGAEAEIPIYRHVNTTEKVIALTFDDGPHPKVTDKILDLLAEYDAKATFFVVGKNVELYGRATARAVREGHEIGNHTYAHPSIGGLGCAEIACELLRTEALVEELTGKSCHIFRPPGGECTKEAQLAALGNGFSLVLWNIDTRDWAGVSSSEIVKNVMSNAAPGSVILFHDYVGKEAGTIDALKEILPRLSAAGYRFVTVSELLSYSASASDSSGGASSSRP